MSNGKEETECYKKQTKNKSESIIILRKIQKLLYGRVIGLSSDSESDSDDSISTNNVIKLKSNIFLNESGKNNTLKVNGDVSNTSNYASPSISNNEKEWKNSNLQKSLSSVSLNKIPVIINVSSDSESDYETAPSSTIFKVNSNEIINESGKSNVLELSAAALETSNYASLSTSNNEKDWKNSNLQKCLSSVSLNNRLSVIDVSSDSESDYETAPSSTIFKVNSNEIINESGKSNVLELSTAALEASNYTAPSTSNNKKDLKNSNLLKCLSRVSLNNTISVIHLSDLEKDETVANNTLVTDVLSDSENNYETACTNVILKAKNDEVLNEHKKNTILEVNTSVFNSHKDNINIELFHLSKPPTFNHENNENLYECNNILNIEFNIKQENSNYNKHKCNKRKDIEDQDKSVNKNSQEPPEKKIKLQQQNITKQYWKSNFDVENSKHFAPTVSVGQSLQFPMAVNTFGKAIFQFFWLDAFEDPYKNPGTVYLFGKVKAQTSFISCCVVVKNIPRRYYLLPKICSNEKDLEGADQNMKKVYNEVTHIMNKNKITDFKCKEVLKFYAFNMRNIPHSSKYLEVRYSASYPPIDSNYCGSAIESIFGNSETALELFLTEKNIKGPCWLDVDISPAHQKSSNTYSWCEIEVHSSMHDISVTRNKLKTPCIPPIVITALNIQMMQNQNKTLDNKVASIGILIHHKFPLGNTTVEPLFNQRYCFVNHSANINCTIHASDELGEIKETNVICCKTEIELLEKLLSLMEEVDPDIIIGSDTGFQYEVLITKILALKITNWSKIGKLKVKTPPTKYKGKYNLKEVIPGRPICDIIKFIEELKMKLTTYELSSVYAFVLNKEVSKHEIIETQNSQNCNIKKLKNCIESTMTEASWILEITMKLNILFLALELTNIAGNTLSRTLMNGVSERIEFLLLHAFYAANYITPDKKKNKKDIVSNKSDACKGGLILDPKKGLYDTLILLMDFSSLYPSIIQEFNICFSTIPGAGYADKELSLPKLSLKEGIIPREVCKLTESRKQIKKLLQNSNLPSVKNQQYVLRQLALKLMANSIYGCLGAEHSRFYAKSLANLIAMKGRKILENTVSLVESFKYEIIYGDTDSIMINTNNMEYENALKIGKNIQQIINVKYKQIELQIDKIFSRLLILNKKQYAALIITKLANEQFQYIREVKGLDVIKRDRCSLACDVGNQVLDEILRDQPIETRTQNVFKILENAKEILFAGKFVVTSLKITKRLSKNPEEYKSTRYFPHIAVAERLNKSSRVRKWKAGDLVPYIICKDGTKRSHSERAYHIEELQTNSELKVDISYYLLNELYPVIIKIVDPIKDIDNVKVAKHLGIDKTLGFARIIKDEYIKKSLITFDNRYRKCQSFKFKCRNLNCKANNVIKSLFNKNATGSLSLMKCCNVDCDDPPWKHTYAIKNKLQLDIRKYISKYYNGVTICDSPLCTNAKRKINMELSASNKCDVCRDGYIKKVYNESDLYYQLEFFHEIFNLNKCNQESNEVIPIEVKHAYNSIKEFIINIIKNNGYCIIDLEKLFNLNMMQIYVPNE